VSIFMCKKCHCIENTALCGHWHHYKDGLNFTCSECDPELGKWHGVFPKRKAYGMLVGEDNYLFSVESWRGGHIHHTKPKGIINEVGEIVPWKASPLPQNGGDTDAHS
jgi:hypothetical protein